METGLDIDLTSEEAKEKITSLLAEKLQKDHKYLKTNDIDETPDYNLDFQPPIYLDINKEYLNKNEKPILFHEKAKIINNLDKKYIGDIESYTQNIDFQFFLSQFDNEDEIDQLEIQDLFNVDLETIGDLKEKTTELLNTASTVVENGDESEGEKENLLLFFCEKLNVIVFINQI